MVRRVSFSRVDWLVTAGLLALLAGCATVDKGQFREILWPEPPLTPRIKFVRVIRSTDDLGKSAGEVFLDALLGKKKTPDSIVRPMAIAVAAGGKRLYVTDFDQGRVAIFDLETRTMRSLGDPIKNFARPFGIALDDKENVYVVDSAKKLVRVFDPNGNFLRNITHDSIKRPTGIAIDSQRRKIYVVDSSNHLVHVFDFDGNHLKSLGRQGTDDGRFFFPTYLAVDREGNLYVTDTLNARVQLFDAEGRHLKNFGQRGDKFGMFDKPKGVAVDTFGNVYVVDSTWSNVQIFNSRAATLLYFAGRGRIPALLRNPTGITIDENNRIYVADTFNSRIAIYQLINTKAEDSFLVAQTRDEKGGERTKVTEEGGAQAKIKENEAVNESKKK